MKKKQLITALATSTLVLSTAGTAFADEVTPIDPTTPSTEVVTPDPSSGSSTNTSSALERIKLSVLTIPFGYIASSPFNQAVFGLTPAATKD